MPFKIVRNDLTKMNTDAIVNTANPKPVYAGGTDRAVYEAAGAEELLAERRKIGAMKPGEAALTPGFALPAKYIIHTVGPVWRGGTHGEEEKLAECYRSSLKIAKEQKLESIAFPLISTGIYGFPKDRALQIALSAFSEFLMQEDMMIYLVIFSRSALQLSKKLTDDIDSYIDDNYVQDKMYAEYSAYDADDTCDGRLNANFTDRDERSRRAYIAELSGLEDAGPHVESANVPEEAEPCIESAEVLEEPDLYTGYASVSEEADLYAETANIPEEDSAYTESANASTASVYSMSQPEDFKSGPACFQSAQIHSKSEPAYYGTAPSYADTASVQAKPSESQLKQKHTAAKPKPKRSLEDILGHVDETFQQQLFRLIKERGMSNVEVYRRANLQKQLFAKIKANAAYVPKKPTALALCVALKLNLDETTDLLGRAGYALSPSSKTDLIVRYFIEHETFDMYTIDTVLDQYGLPMIGVYD